MSGRLALLIGAAALVFFAAGALRHLRIRSTAYDLGIFDQAVWLISIGATPVSSILGTHILGDHAAPIWYALALPYAVYASVYWLLGIQAVALALGAWPTYLLARDAGLPSPRALLMAGVYLLYPTLFDASVFDFHPEVLAVPAVLAAVLAARRRRLGWFCAAVALILSCKAILALTVVAMASGSCAASGDRCTARAPRRPAWCGSRSRRSWSLPHTAVRMRRS